jgi:flagellar biosynthesis protein FlhA
LAEVARAHAAELVGRQELHTLFEHLRASVPSVIKEIGTESLPFASVHRAFSLLLREMVWPRDPVRVLEAMLEAGTRDAGELAEAARRAVVPELLRRRAVATLEPAIFDPEFERTLVSAWGRGGTDAASPSIALALRDRVAAYAAGVRPRERAAVVCTAALRPLLADFLLRSGIRLDVFSYGELPAELALLPSEVIAV